MSLFISPFVHAYSALDINDVYPADGDQGCKIEGDRLLTAEEAKSILPQITNKVPHNTSYLLSMNGSLIIDSSGKSTVYDPKFDHTLRFVSKSLCLKPLMKGAVDYDFMSISEITNKATTQTIINKGIYFKEQTYSGIRSSNATDRIDLNKRGSGILHQIQLLVKVNSTSYMGSFVIRSAAENNNYKFIDRRSIGDREYFGSPGIGVSFGPYQMNLSFLTSIPNNTIPKLYNELLYPEPSFSNSIKKYILQSMNGPGNQYVYAQAILKPIAQNVQEAVKDGYAFVTLTFIPDDIKQSYGLPENVLLTLNAAKLTDSVVKVGVPLLDKAIWIQSDPYIMKAWESNNIFVASGDKQSTSYPLSSDILDSYTDVNPYIGSELSKQYNNIVLFKHIVLDSFKNNSPDDWAVVQSDFLSRQKKCWSSVGSFWSRVWHFITFRGMAPTFNNAPNECANDSEIMNEIPSDGIQIIPEQNIELDDTINVDDAMLYNTDTNDADDFDDAMNVLACNSDRNSTASQSLCSLTERQAIHAVGDLTADTVYRLLGEVSTYLNDSAQGATAPLSVHSDNSALDLFINQNPEKAESFLHSAANLIINSEPSPAELISLRPRKGEKRKTGVIVAACSKKLDNLTPKECIDKVKVVTKQYAKKIALPPRLTTSDHYYESGSPAFSQLVNRFINSRMPVPPGMTESNFATYTAAIGWDAAPAGRNVGIIYLPNPTFLTHSQRTKQRFAYGLEHIFSGNEANHEVQWRRVHVNSQQAVLRLVMNAVTNRDNQFTLLRSISGDNQARLYENVTYVDGRWHRTISNVVVVVASNGMIITAYPTASSKVTEISDEI